MDWAVAKSRYEEAKAAQETSRSYSCSSILNVWLFLAEIKEDNAAKKDSKEEDSEDSDGENDSIGEDQLSVEEKPNVVEPSTKKIVTQVKKNAEARDEEDDEADSIKDDSEVEDESESDEDEEPELGIFSRQVCTALVGSFFMSIYSRRRWKSYEEKEA